MPRTDCPDFLQQQLQQTESSLRSLRDLCNQKSPDDAGRVASCLESVNQALRDVCQQLQEFEATLLPEAAQQMPSGQEWQPAHNSVEELSPHAGAGSPEVTSDPVVETAISAASPSEAVAVASESPEPADTAASSLSAPSLGDILLRLRLPVDTDTASGPLQPAVKSISDEDLLGLKMLDLVDVSSSPAKEVPAPPAVPAIVCEVREVEMAMEMRAEPVAAAIPEPVLLAAVDPSRVYEAASQGDLRTFSVELPVAGNPAPKEVAEQKAGNLVPAAPATQSIGFANADELLNLGDELEEEGQAEFVRSAIPQSNLNKLEALRLQLSRIFEQQGVSTVSSVMPKSQSPAESSPAAEVPQESATANAAQVPAQGSNAGIRIGALPYQPWSGDAPREAEAALENFPDCSEPVPVETFAIDLAAPEPVAPYNDFEPDLTPASSLAPQLEDLWNLAPVEAEPESAVLPVETAFLPASIHEPNSDTELFAPPVADEPAFGFASRESRMDSDPVDANSRHPQLAEETMIESPELRKPTVGDSILSLSTAALLANLDLDDDEGQTGRAAKPAATQETRPVPPVSPASGPSRGEPEEDVQDYMQQLMSRLRGGSSQSSVRQPEPTAVLTPAKTGAENKAVVATPEVPAEPVQPLTEEEFKPRAQAPEKKVDLNALRSIANESTRTAIDQFAERQKKAVYGTQLAAISAGIVGAAIFGVLASSLGSMFYLLALGCVGVSGWAGWQFMKDNVLPPGNSEEAAPETTSDPSSPNQSLAN